MNERWADTRGLLEHLADADLRQAGAISPTMAAFEGDRLLFLADLRPFPPGGLGDALVEVLALAFPLGADRIAYSLDGRAWSLEDPIPPVLDGVGDLRARVHTMVLFDGHGREAPQVTSVIRPYDLAGGTPVWRTPVTPPEPPGGWATAATVVGLTNRDQLRRGGTSGLVDQAVRCEQLGHVLRLGAAGAERLGVGAADDGLSRHATAEGR